jgi:hypothetical protein
MLEINQSVLAGGPVWKDLVAIIVLEAVVDICRLPLMVIHGT